jgi:RimJ/RimL family protein N-acetyltransferase
VSKIVIETPRLFLRTWRDGDDDLLKLHTETPTFKRWLEDEDMAPRRPGSTTAHQQRMQAELGLCFWVVERRSDGAFLGYCGLKHVDAEGTDLLGEVEIGWGLREDAWGKGYAREAATAALDRAFAVHGAERVCAFTVIGNMASWGLMERLGMTRRPDLDYHDPSFSDALNPTIVYLITRSEWDAR